MAPGFPYLPGVSDSETIEDGNNRFVLVKFPFLKRNYGPYRYKLRYVVPYQSQLIDGKFVPIQTIQNKKSLEKYEKLVQRYEQKFNEY